MFCPRCGVENEKGSRYCSSCGASLKKGRRKERRSIKDRLAALVGGSRRERLLTLGTIIAIAIAVIAFVALDFDDSDLPDPEQSQAADSACVEAKQGVAEAATRSQASGSINTYGIGLVIASLNFREALRAQGFAGAEAAELDAALRDAAIEAGVLARLGREDAAPGEIGAQAQRTNAAFARVDAGIEELGLRRCAAVGITPAGRQAPAGE